MRKFKRAKDLWQDLRKSVSKKHNPLAGMNKQKAIDAIRKVREKLWEEKFAHRS